MRAFIQNDLGSDHSQELYAVEQDTGFFDIVGNPLALGVNAVTARIFLSQQTASAPNESGLVFTQRGHFKENALDYNIIVRRF